MCANELIMCVRVCMRACDRTRNTNTVHNQLNSMSSHTYKIYVSTDIYVNLSFSLLETQKLLWQRKRKVKYASSIKRCLFDLYLCIVVISCYLCANLDVWFLFHQQECIPVLSVPFAAVAIPGGYLPRRVSTQGVSAKGGVCLAGGVYLAGACTPAPSPPVDRQTPVKT